AYTGDQCFLAWLISTKDCAVVNRGFKSRLPSLHEDELLLENCYTFEQYRGNGIMPSVVFELWEMARSRGFKRMIAYVRQDNEASLRALEKIGFRKSNEIRELKLLFSTTRNHN
ncbi:MAG: GNAT family N-acetyltransferase, partial [Dehalococcoidia bacterium]